MYVVRQVAEKGNDTRYPSERTRAILSWLALQMQVHYQPIFYAENLQIDWLALDEQPTVTWLAMRLPAIVLGGCVSLLASVLLVINYELVFLLQMGLLGGFVGSHLSPQVVAEPISKSFAGTRAHIRNALLLGLLVAASSGVSLSPGDYNLSDWFRDGYVLGLGSLLSGWAFQVLLDRTPKEWVPVPYKRLDLRGRLITWMNTIVPLHIWQAALLLGTGVGLSYGLSYGLRYGLSYGLNYGWVNFGLNYGLNCGLTSGLIVSIIVVLTHAVLAGPSGPLRLAERIRWTWHGLLRSEHLRTSLIVAGASFLFFGLTNGLTIGLIFGLNFGLSAGLTTAALS